MSAILDEINNNGRSINVLVDANSMMYRTIFALKNELEKNAYQDFGMFKSALLENVFYIKNLFKNPNVILCFDKKDNGKYWRHEIYSGYKEQRKKQSSPIPKEVIYKQFSEIMTDIKENIPWMVYSVDGVEADDLIAVYIRSHANENNIIVGVDKDYIMLTQNSNVKLLNPSKKDFEIVEDPIKFKFEHIISGDLVDNVRNIFSSLEHNGTRQKPVTKKMLTEMFNVYKKDGMEKFVEIYLNTPQIKKRFVENRKLIDSDFIPSEYIKKIDEVFNNTKITTNFSTARKYFLSHHMRTMLDITMNGI